MTEEVQDEIVVTCFNCTLQIQRNVYIKCAECVCAVCVPCFQFGAESCCHKRGHNYEVIDPYGFSTSSGDWGYLEEGRLIHTMHKYKMGNWNEIVENMKANKRDVAEAQEYFDKTFVRGWIGQFAIKEGGWPKKKSELLTSGRFEELMLPQSDSTERLLMIRDALREYEGTINVNDPKIVDKVNEIFQDYLERLTHDDVTMELNVGRTTIDSDSLSPDELDPSDIEDEKFCATSRRTKLNEEKVSLKDLESDNDMSPQETRRNRSEREKNGFKYRRIQRDSSTDEEQYENSDAEEHRSKHAKEESSSNIDDSDVNDEGKRNNSRRNVQKRRPLRRMKMSKKERRNAAFLRRMNNQNKKHELTQLQKLETICPLSEMADLRNALPRLALESKQSVRERPKLRLDDLRMLMYSIDREEFEQEWFNDAEQLISRLTFGPTPPAENDLWANAENEIKFSRIQLYNRILSARKAKRNAILEHDKITSFFNFMKDSTVDKRTPTQILEERPIMEKLMSRAQQFLNKEEHKDFSDMMDRLTTLKQKISTLQALQKDGETTKPQQVTPAKIIKRKKKTNWTERNKRAQRCWDAYKRHHRKEFIL